MGNRAYLRHLEQLFLLEVLVERVDIERPCCVPMKVHCQFIDLLPFEINQQEFRSELDAAAAAVEASAVAAAEMGYGCPDTCFPLPEPPGKIATGKSCLFPMLPLELIKCLKRYPLVLKVYRIMGDCCEGEMLDHVGTANVNLALPHFCDTIRRSTICGERLPLVGCMANVYPLYKDDEKGRNVECGTIEIFTRLSCFGHNILTHFQLLGAERAFVFKNSDKDEEKKCLICPKDNKPACQQVVETDVSPYKPCPADDLWLEQDSPCVLGPRFAEQPVEWGLKGTRLHPPNQPVCSSSGGLKPGDCCPSQGQPCVPNCPAEQSNDNCNCPPCIKEAPPMCPIPECKAIPQESTYCTPSCPPGSGHCPPESGHCPPESGHCPPGSGHYPSGSDHCPPGSGHCPPGSGHCPPGSGHCPPGSGHYPPGSGHCPPGSGHCPPGSGHCPPGSGHCPPGSGHCPPGSGHCPPGSGHCPPGSGHCPPGSGHCPPGSGHCPPGSGHCPPPSNSCCCGASSPQSNLGLCPPQPGCPYAPGPPPCNPPKPSVCTPNPYLQKNEPPSRNYYMDCIKFEESNPDIEEIPNNDEIVQEGEKKNSYSECPPPRETHSTRCSPCPPKPPFGCVIPPKPTCPGFGGCPTGACPSPPPLCPPPLKGSENWPPTPNVKIPCPLSCDIHKLSLPEEITCCPEECHDKKSKVPIRYDTTGKLSPAYMGDKLRLPLPRLHPPVRYDTTGALSPAFMGNIYDTSKQHPPVRYDTTGALSPAYQWSMKPPKLEGKRPCPGGCGGYEADSDDPTGATCACKQLMGASSDESDKICDCADWGGMDVTYDFTLVKPLRPEGMGPIEPYASFDGGCVCRTKEYAPKFPGKAFCAQRDPKLDMLEKEQNLKLEAAKHDDPSRPKFLKNLETDKYIHKKSKTKRNKQKHRPNVPRSKKIRNYFRGRYVNKIGLNYPGIHIGHHHCTSKYPRVPSTMGWLWNLRQTVFGLKYRPGWRPGAIAKTVMAIMEGKELAPVATRGRRALFGTESKSTIRSRAGKQQSGPTKDEMNIRPTLHLHRKNGAYYISMHPVNINSETEAVPLQFKIPGCHKEDGTTEYGSDSSSELEIEFLAPGSFEPKKIEANLKSLGTYVTEKDILKATKLKKKGKGDGKGGKGGKGGVGGIRGVGAGRGAGGAGAGGSGAGGAGAGGAGGAGAGGEGADGKNKYGSGGGTSMVYQPKICQDEPATPCWDPCYSWMETQNPCNPCNPCYPCYPSCYH